MKILAIADRPPLRSIKEIVSESNVDLICTLGDLELLQIKELADITHIPKLGVYGNHCSGRYFEDLGILNLHLKTFEYNGFKFGGFEGSHRYKESSDAKMYTQEEATHLLQNFPYVDVMISHSPPFGINDESQSLSHQGFIALRDYIKKQQPKYFLHGHTYPSEENVVTKFENTNIIYVYADKVIEI
ncbi:MAG: serine/threonine protein phosphatase [Candidatus Dojkabacteria bacterium]|nr:MAG: serine/threonine protein phosphatase [Candidatus Dojkabacteria bacterium]